MKSSFKITLNMIKPYLVKELVAIFLTLLYSLFVFASPFVFKYLIDETIPSRSLKKLYFGIGLFFLVNCAQPIIGYFKDSLLGLISENIKIDNRKTMFTKVVNAPLPFFDTTKKGEILSRILNDTNISSGVISNFFIVFLKNILIIVLVMCGMLLLSVKISIIIIFILFLFSFLTLLFNQKLKNISHDVQKNYDEFSTIISQMTDSIVTIKSNLLEKYFSEKFGSSLAQAYKNSKKIIQMEILSKSLINLLILLSMCIIYGMGSFMIIGNEITLGTVIALGVYFQSALQPISELLNYSIDFNKSIPILERLEQYFEMESEPIDGKMNLTLKGDVSIENLNFSYLKDEVRALKNITMQIKDKSFIGLIGPSGSGKSTLIKILMGFYKDFEGMIKIDNMDIKNVGMDTLRKNIGYVSQEMDIFNMSIIDNIRCEKYDISDGKIIELCKKLKIHNKILSLPNGYNSIINERVNLSGGEKQRIAIARALLKKPSILVLDEPTSSLDYENETKVKEIIEDISKECTVIIITHKTSIVNNADEIYTFNDGTLTYMD